MRTLCFTGSTVNDFLLIVAENHNPLTLLHWTRKTQALVAAVPVRDLTPIDATVTVVGIVQHLVCFSDKAQHSNDTANRIPESKSF